MGYLSRIKEQKITQTTVITTDYTSAIDMDKIATLSVQSVIDVNTPAAGTFASTDVSTTNDTITIAATTYVTGLKGRFTTSGTLPTGISAGVDYFVISSGTTAYKFADSLAHAQAGTQIDITGAGAGNSTFTPSALAGGSISYQKSNVTNSDGTASSTAGNWDDIDTATTITADATVWYEKIGPDYRWFRIKTTSTAGQMTNNHYVLTRGMDPD